MAEHLEKTLLAIGNVIHTQLIQADGHATVEGGVYGLTQLLTLDTLGSMDQVLANGAAVDAKGTAGNGVDHLDIVVPVYDDHADRQLEHQAFLRKARAQCTLSTD